MVYPGYLLNPGDMFQVDVDRVMFATGQKKGKLLTSPKKSSRSGEEAAEEATAEEQDGEAEASEATEESAEPAAKSVEEDPAAALEKERDALKAFRSRLRAVLKDQSQELKAKQKQELRRLAKEVKTTMSRIGKPNADPRQSANDVHNLEALFSSLNIGDGEGKAPTPKTAAVESSESASAPREKDGGAPLTPLERERLDKFLADEAQNPHDPSKPYLTPWQPRPYMSAFAFIPRYLEVNQKICAAVYLRHPVARLGAAEVPTPFPHDISQLAFNWYLRRG